MLAQIVAVVLAVFVFTELKSRCFTRHAILCAGIPIVFSMWTELLAAAGFRISIAIFFGQVSLDVLALIAAASGMVLARKLGDRFSRKYSEYWASLA